MILITGATGRTGSQAAKLLAQKGEKVRALVRNPEKAAALQAAGVEIAVGDAGDLRQALADLHAGHDRGNRPHFALNLARGVGFRIKRFVLRRRTEGKQQDA